MKISLIENGIDSLQKGFERLKIYEDLYISKPDEVQERYYNLKDAVLSIHHGVEILMKYILSQNSEFLLFTKIDDNVKNAYKECRRKSLNTVFETSLNSKISTISYTEAFERLHKVCGYDFSNEFSQHLKKLNEFRNQITHSEINVDEIEIKSLFRGFLNELDLFFFKTIGEDYKTLSGYSTLISNYQAYIDVLDANGLETKKNAITFFKETFEKNGLSMGFNEVKYIDNIDIAYNILKDLFESDFRFGADFYNYHTTGAITELKRLDKERISLFSKDNNVEYIFKFQGLILYLPEAKNNESPMLFFASKEDEHIDKALNMTIEKDYQNKRFVEGIHFINRDETVFDLEKKYEYFSQEDNDPYFVREEYFSKLRFLDELIVGFVNIQGLDYRMFNSLIPEFSNMKAEQLEVILNRVIKK